MSPPHRSAEETAPPGFTLRRDGSGVKMDWRTLVAVLMGAVFMGGAWWTLQDHGKRIDDLSSKVGADHEILVELRAYMRTGDTRAFPGR